MSLGAQVPGWPSDPPGTRGSGTDAGRRAATRDTELQSTRSLSVSQYRHMGVVTLSVTTVPAFSVTPPRHLGAPWLLPAGGVLGGLQSAGDVASQYRQMPSEDVPDATAAWVLPGSTFYSRAVLAPPPPPRQPGNRASSGREAEAGNGSSGSRRVMHSVRYAA
ncbi:fumarylacetoacetate hydrolase family protein, putative [Babesia ovata]|uniref:Fumarylacetoacetate hydrolase family protein, putative n=1 Tax=Babesia ovata TaxID=189622 RepID=A0A2H6KHE0_9APIC|nr:fumarylacetoacetate hydrolase family protein, putative [Babesia ovata]GBE62408.1 fumarylacetoacetate hydrolase family protein, putative [Babesia ovata]